MMNCILITNYVTVYVKIKAPPFNEKDGRNLILPQNKKLKQDFIYKYLVFLLLINTLFMKKIIATFLLLLSIHLITHSTVKQEF
jgi:hypothetical protein